VDRVTRVKPHAQGFATGEFVGCGFLMSKKLSVLILAFLAGLATSCTNVGDGGGGGTVQVSFQSPENFTDMSRSSPSSRGADEGYLSELRQYIERTGASRIPAGHTLSLTITDVDMAGQFEPERGPRFMDIRVVKTIYPPRITLNYRLTDPTGAVVSEGDRRLTDMSFEYNSTPINQDDSLRYEKELIDDFLKDIAREAVKS
jgi:hypothetical protein